MPNQTVRKILLLSAYDAVSHRLWRERVLSLFPQDSWTQLVLSPRHFSWRIRGNSLVWALTERETLAGKYDLILATSMVDLSALRGFVPSLASIPTLLYFHENQFAYPSNREVRPNVEHQLVPLYSALCANHIAFNSHYNRTTFLAGAVSLFNRLPDKIPATLSRRLESSSVLPVPLARQTPSNNRRSAGPLQVVWNHRWEYDKGPELLNQLVIKLAQTELAIQLHVVGERFKQVPPQFESIQKNLDLHSQRTGVRRGQYGFVESTRDYYNLLGSCDVVLSTALHDFQGLAVQEACLAGCIPLTPDDLAYTDYVPERYRYPLAKTAADTAQTIISRLEELLNAKNNNAMPPRVTLDSYQGEAIAAQYELQFQTLLTKAKS